VLSLKEELLLSRANIQLALFSILFTAAAVAAAYALSSLFSLSLALLLSFVFNGITQKK
jgi:hypothetical protein